MPRGLNHLQPFHFYTECRLVQLTGTSARNLPELAAILHNISGSSIFYHTHHGFLSHHFEKPVVYNDFAVWVLEALQEDALAEKLAAIDLLAFTTIRQLREAILELIESYLPPNHTPVRQCPPGDEFHLCRSKSFILPTGLVARNPAEFFVKLRAVTNASLYFHFLEARLRLGKPTNDFSQWLESHGQVQLAEAVDQLDPYSHTLDELKEDLLQLGIRYEVY